MKNTAFRRCMAGAIAVALLMSGCSGRETGGGPQPEPPPTASAPSAAIPSAQPPPTDSREPEASAVSSPPERDADPDYIGRVVRETAAKFTKPGMSEYEKAKAAFDYLIETTSLTEPVGLELWRIRGRYGTPPGFVENRSLSVLLYGIGMCEDYAAALTMLLRGMGLEAEYVPGLTYAANGSGLVDHSWTVARIDGVWYHLDCQLEDNVSRRDTIRYKYFMRGDDTMSASHRWGQNLLDANLLTPEQNAEIARDFLYEPCPQDYPTPPPRSFTPAQPPDVSALRAAVEAERREYERTHGPLPPLELNIVPPVFGLAGSGPPD